MFQPKVSVLIATYNRPNLISRALKSVLDQSFTDLEIVVVDDSEDNRTAEVMKDWVKRDRHITYLKPGHIGRIAIVSNIGLREAKGEYVAILDDDDYWADPRKLEKQVKFLNENPAYVGCGGGFIVVDERGGKEQGRFLKPQNDQDIRRRALLANPMVNSTAMFRRSIALKAGGYDETILEFADWDFWLKMGLAGKLYNFPEYFIYYLMWDRGSSFSKQKGTAISAVRIVKRYKSNYPNSFWAIMLAYLYRFYTKLPDPIKRFLNPLLSRLKKTVFAA